ncbi:MAG: 16S rRNA (adenine(1518)-N(6)/adenine(1519)-N(6))-dimethyltransferase RsmA [Syntrophomonadaceae bacterium]|nr:16S rRNA (adenine(1518)-N(6)/adenine(1519)-N(6))-dimethyltransferase RsmA [Syntrophomonadaceae bacterium]MDD3024323.1 16S rRNA (adenine(1518)-N(6)/adenine(1519)-N(6))-dimethyltransferase RsmA [Syntrophomonadaceae bacterium]
MSGPESIATVQKMMKQYNLFPKKKWGQNFLVDGNILNKIADSCDLNQHEYVVEIGPGLGALTHQLASRSQGVLSIEIDNSLQEALQPVLDHHTNVRLLFADVLKVNIESAIKQTFNLTKIPQYQVCANIPYNITTPIIFQLLENCPNMTSATLMMQKEVAQRILAVPGNKEYGLLTLMMAYYSEAKFLMKVSHNCFYPRPEVDSSVIRITPLREKRVRVDDENIFKQFCRAAFQKRRKTILNICSGFFKLEKTAVEKHLTEMGISPKSRPENLNIQEFARITDTLAQY